MNKPIATDRNAKLLKVLGNKYRMQIIELLLIEGELIVTHINNKVKVSQPALSQHLSKLRRAGIVKARREQRQIHYSLTSAGAMTTLRDAVGAI